MHVVSAEGIQPEKLQFHAISAIKNPPRFLRDTVDKRKNSAFLYIISGAYRYTFREGSFTARSGDMVYIPKGASYRYEVAEKGTMRMQFEFDLCEGGGDVVFSSRPEIALRGNPSYVQSTFEEIVLLQPLSGSGSQLKVLSAAYALLDAYLSGKREHITSKASKKIQPAVDYIRANYSKKIYVSELAEMCYLSESQLRRLFDSELNMSPVEYKNKVLAEAACNMLRSDYVSVGEVAEALGYTSVYAFSQSFKKAVGVSPKNYARG